VNSINPFVTFCLKNSDVNDKARAHMGDMGIGKKPKKHDNI
jgi:hypothetical protein